MKGNKKRAEEMLSHLRKSFVVPRAPADYFDFSDRMLFTDFMRAWLEVVRTTVVPTTFGGYQTTVEKKFIPYFKKKNLALANVQAKDLQTFYLHEMKTLSGTTVRHEHALLHKILKYAYRMDLIPNNPADKVDPPRAERFEGSAYTEEELALLIEQSWDHKLGLLIYFAHSAGQKTRIVFLPHPILISPLHFNFVIFSKMSKLNLTNDKNDNILYDRQKYCNARSLCVITITKTNGKNY